MKIHSLHDNYLETNIATPKIFLFNTNSLYIRSPRVSPFKRSLIRNSESTSKTPFLWPFKELLSRPRVRAYSIRIAEWPIFVRLGIIAGALARTLTQFRHPPVSLARRRLTYSPRTDARRATCAKVSRGTPAKTDLRERRESTVPRLKFMLREATVLAETLFSPVRNGCNGDRP